MFKQFFGAARKNRQIADTLYEQIVAAARQEVPYSQWDVPDTPLGRYEMLSIALFLVMHRLKGQGKAADGIGQELADTFVRDVEHSLRELGIGDMGIPKRMKKLSRMFYGRATSYGAALEAGNLAELTAALQRNVRPDATQWPEAGRLAAYMAVVNAALAAQPIDAILAGRVEFPPAGDGTTNVETV